MLLQTHTAATATTISTVTTILVTKAKATNINFTAITTPATIITTSTTTVATKAKGFEAKHFWNVEAVLK